MPDYDNTNRGALFKNKDKKAENHPDYKGKLNADGVDYWLSAWLKESKEGQKYMSLSITPAEEKQAKPKAKPADDDDIPW